MRSNLDKIKHSEYAMEVAPLQELIGEIMKRTGSAKSFKLKSVQLKEIWKEEHSKCFDSSFDSSSSKGWMRSVSRHGCFGFPLGRHCDTDAERRLGLGCLGAET
jgi:hypothetical protein